MKDNMSVESNSVSSVDRPSFYWNKKYLDKVNGIVEQNIDNNNSEKISIYKKFPKFFKISFWHFIPFFIGYFLSMSSLFASYGRIKSSSIFNKQLYKYFFGRYISLILIYFVFGPVLLIVLILFYPVLGGLNFNTLVSGWQQLFSGNFDGFVTTVIVPTFNSNAWWIGLLVIGLISSINISVIISYFVINKQNDLTITLFTLEDNLKMKISRFVSPKKKKMIKKFITVEVQSDQQISENNSTTTVEYTPTKNEEQQSVAG